MSPTKQLSAMFSSPGRDASPLSLARGIDGGLDSERVRPSAPPRGGDVAAGPAALYFSPALQRACGGGSAMDLSTGDAASPRLERHSFQIFFYNET